MIEVIRKVWNSNKWLNIVAFSCLLLAVVGFLVWKPLVYIIAISIVLWTRDVWGSFLGRGPEDR